MLDNSARSLGIFREQWLAELLSAETSGTGVARSGAEQQQIIAVHVEKIGQSWLHDDLLPLLERALARKLARRTGWYFRLFDPVILGSQTLETARFCSYRLECCCPSAETPVWLF